MNYKLKKLTQADIAEAFKSWESECADRDEFYIEHADLFELVNQHIDYTTVNGHKTVYYGVCEGDTGNVVAFIEVIDSQIAIAKSHTKIMDVHASPRYTEPKYFNDLAEIYIFSLTQMISIGLEKNKKSIKMYTRNSDFYTVLDYVYRYVNENKDNLPFIKRAQFEGRKWLAFHFCE